MCLAEEGGDSGREEERGMHLAGIGWMREEGKKGDSDQRAKALKFPVEWRILCTEMLYTKGQRIQNIIIYFVNIQIRGGTYRK